MARVKPWMVAVTLSVAGVVGATSVLVAGRALHRSDARDLAAWQRVAGPHIASLRAEIDGVSRLAERSGSPSARDVAAVQARIGSARSALTNLPAPKIVVAVAEAYKRVATEALGCVDALRMRTESGADGARTSVEVADAVDRALASLAAADAVLAELDRRF